MSKYVLFFHPGSEKQVVNEVCEWSKKKLHGKFTQHSRKFMEAYGSVIDSEKNFRKEKFRFWGEWEACSKVINYNGPLNSNTKHEPKWIHEPIRPKKPLKKPKMYHNTDPVVFGDKFIYSNCKQYNKNKSGMQNLKRGDVIFFGSCIKKEFVLDTVFVVDKKFTYSKQRISNDMKIEYPEWFQYLTLDTLDEKEYTFYTGATYDNPVNGMYSFVPCIIKSDSNASFLRPNLPKEINDAHNLKNGRFIKYINNDTHNNLWGLVKQYILDKNLSLAVKINL
ncbi:hypothetical protein [Staphylococcus borealis]|uniref:hypothetical protein n=1 Tax=Staphylococcus borealis TaxID=2742203 RepID=UPI002A827328|nr:hypothetical protein [Staphylococcus borealis]MDY4021399.1 hypothetical protein [Staphylococcus borealis]